MSRLGKRPILIPDGVTVELKPPYVSVSKDKKILSKPVFKGVDIKKEDNNLVITPVNDNSFSRSMWGTSYSVITGMIEGVNNGFTTSLEIVGVGFKAELSGNALLISLGYSHEIFITIPEEVEVKCEKNTLLHISSYDKEALGHFIALIQSLRKKDPYKGKGIYKVGEYRRRKKGKNK